ncbi:hypothetical protein CDL15_Pgr014744 [Punica granatum]|uniref:Uncharacterized protein n=1 Tax=Punica granatum TaxID=22663 RepID=A0A218Y0X2_PUNGR|nr:hypothetical protein CDL15_Pgr014744 [Punica granatum]
MSSLPLAVSLVPCSGEDPVQETLSPSSDMRKFLLNLPLLCGSGTHGTCLVCKECTDDWCDLRLDYLEPGLRVGRKVVRKLQESISRNLLDTGKLHLILDLGNMLLHLTSCSNLIPDEQHLVAECNDLDKTTGDLFVETKGVKITKLRPFVHSSLREGSTIFDLTVYMMGP